MAHIVDDVLAGEQVFRRLVLKYATLRFIKSVLGKDAVLIQRRHRGLGNDVIDLFLIQFPESLQGFQGIAHRRIHLRRRFGLFVGHGFRHIGFPWAMVAE